MSCQPRIDRRQGLTRHFDLPQRDPKRGTAEPVVGRWKCRWLASGRYACEDLAFDIEKSRVAEADEEFLKRRMKIVPEMPAMAEGVPRRMGRVEMRARNPPSRNELCRRVRTLVPQQPGKDMGVRTLGTSSVSRRYRLIHFNAPDPADEHAMGIGRQDNSHCIVAGFEQRSAGSFPYRRDDLRIASPNTSIELQRAKAEVEEDRRPIFRVQRIAIGADFGEDRAPIHCADVFGEAQCYAMTSALRRQ